MAKKPYKRKMQSMLLDDNSGLRLFTAHTYDYVCSIPGVSIHWKKTSGQNHNFSYQDLIINYHDFHDLIDCKGHYLDRLLGSLFTFEEVSQLITYIWKTYGLLVMPKEVPLPLDIGVYDKKGNPVGIIEVKSERLTGGVYVDLSLEVDEYHLTFCVEGFEEAGCNIDQIILYSERQ